MKIIKTKRANLENKRAIYFEIGLILALAVVLLAFEWRSIDAGGMDMDWTRDVPMDEDMVEITIQEQKTPPKPKEVIAQIFEVVDNDELFEEEFLEINAEDDDENLNNLENLFEDEDDRETEEITPFAIVQEMPSFHGGDEAYFRYMKQNLKYPQWAREAGISGIVYVEFVIAADGFVTKASIKRGIGGGCDDEALRVVNNMPQWNPGRQLNIAVPVIMTLPVHFKILK